MTEPLLQVHNLNKSFMIKTGWLRKSIKTLRAVHNVSLSVAKGETFGLVGESGSGKSTVGKCIVGLYTPTSGEIFINGRRIDQKGSKKVAQLVFQDPTSSLNPRRTVSQTVALPLQLYEKPATKKQLNARIRELLEMVELPWEMAGKMPKSLSGGQRQRVAIARALACRPLFIILDEPTSALDVSVQAKVINLLDDLQNRLELSYLFITHDLSLVRNVAARTAVMYLGQICEVAKNEWLFTNPRHPYTRTLLSAIPVVSKQEEKLKPVDIEVQGEIPSPLNAPRGCSFHTRCAQAMPVCSTEEPIEVEVEEGHLVQCHLYKDGGLK